MAGFTIEQARSWRRQVIEAEQFNVFFEFVDPCRNKESLEGKGLLTHHGYADSFMCEEQTIFARDTHDISRCDAVLANFGGAEKVSVGTIFELGMAWTLKKPIVTVGLIHGPYDHIFTRQCAAANAGDLEEGLTILRSLFNFL
jgi:nucleoside 2-deoxyribosyltransferase